MEVQSQIRKEDNMKKIHILPKLAFCAICLFSVAMTSPSYGDKQPQDCGAINEHCKKQMGIAADPDRKSSACGVFWGGRGIGNEGIEWCRNNWNNYGHEIADVGWQLCLASTKNLQTIGGCDWK